MPKHTLHVKIYFASKLKKLLDTNYLHKSWGKR